MGLNCKTVTARQWQDLAAYSFKVLLTGNLAEKG